MNEDERLRQDLKYAKQLLEEGIPLTGLPANVKLVSQGLIRTAERLDEAKKALTELVRLKDLKDKRLQRDGVTWDHPADQRDYEYNKPKAWAEARRVVKKRED